MQESPIRVKVFPLRGMALLLLLLMSLIANTSGEVASPNVTVEYVSSTSIQLRWTQPDDLLRTITSYEISVLSNGPCFTGVYLNSFNISGTRRSWGFGASEFSDYNFTITAIDVDVRSTPTSVDVRTLPAAPGNPPQITSVTAVNTTSIVIEWSEVDCRERNGVINGYMIRYVRYTEDLIPTDPVFVNVSADGDRELTLTGLLLLTPYLIEVAAFNDQGLGRFHNGGKGYVIQGDSTIRETTLTPGEVASPNVTVEYVSSNTVRFRWTQPDDLLRMITFYDISMWNNGPCFTGVYFNSVNYSGTLRSWGIFAPEFSDYVFTITAIDVDVRSIPTSVVVRTLPAAPGNPPQITSVTAVDTTSIVIEWSEVDCRERNGVITGYMIRYVRYTEDLIPTDPIFVNVSVDGERELTLAGLLLLTPYQIEVAAFNDQGLGRFQNGRKGYVIQGDSTIRETTLTPGEVAAPNVTVTFVDSTSVLLRWIQPDDLYRTITSFEFSWGRIGPCSSGNFIKSYNFSGAYRSYYTYGLQEFGDYTYTMTAIDVDVRSTPTSVAVRTLPAAPGYPPRITSVLAVNLTSIAIEWREVECLEQNGVITGYTVRYSPVTEELIPTNTTYVNVSAESPRKLILYGLLPQTPYQIEVSALNDQGMGRFYNYDRKGYLIHGDGTIRETYIIPREIAAPNLTVSDVTDSSFVILWSNDDGQRRIIYELSQVFIGPCVDYNHDDVYVYNVSNKYTGVSFTYDVQESSIYMLNFTAVDGDIRSPPTTVVVRTLPAVPGNPPQITTVAAVNKTSIVIEWSEVECLQQNGDITGYIVRYSPLNQDLIPTDTILVNVSADGDRELTLTGLLLLTPYQIEVAVFNDQGPGRFYNSRTGYLILENGTIGETTLNGREVPAASVNYQYIQATSIYIRWIQSDNTLPTITFYEISEVFIGPCVSNQDVLTYNHSYPSLSRRGLQEFSEYLFNITAIDGDFRSATTTVIMKTLPTAPSVPPRITSVQAVNTTSIAIEWSEVDCWEQNGVITGYMIRYVKYTEDLIPTDPVFVNVSADGDREITLTGLVPRTKYHIAVTAFSDYGIAPFGTDAVVSPVCPEELIGGILWPQTMETHTTTLSCTLAGSSFRQGTFITRTCLLNGVWNDVDFTSCTLESVSSEPFLIVYYTLNDSQANSSTGSVKKRAVEILEVSDHQTILAESKSPRVRNIRASTDPLDEQNLLTEMENLLRDLNVNVSSLTLLNLYHTDDGVSVVFEIILASGSELVFNFTDYFTNRLLTNGFAGYPVEQNGAMGLTGIAPTEFCECGTIESIIAQYSNGSNKTFSFNFLELCAGLSLSPCNCTITGNCSCQPPYVGDGSRCTLDSDGDGFPDVAVNTPVCQETLGIPFCTQDVCPTVNNGNQDPEACEEVTDTMHFTGCLFGPDLVWNIDWPNTERDTVSTQRCPGELDAVTGSATRYCDNEGMWSEPDVLPCLAINFQTIIEQAAVTFLLSINSSEISEQTVELTMRLAAVTEPSSMPLLPSSLYTTNKVLTGILDILEEVSNDTSVAASEFVIDVFNNVLDRNNTQGWMALLTSDAGSQVLLDNAERFGVLLARSQNINESDQPVRISRPNIAISAMLYDGSTDLQMEDLRFPHDEDLVNFSSITPTAEVQVPVGLLQERLDQQGGGSLPIVFILFQNLEAFLPTSVSDLGNNTRGASTVVSIQVGERRTPQRSPLLEKYPISLNFTFDKVDNALEYLCVFWNFTQPIGNGQWINDGVTTHGNSSDGSSTKVECTSTHLTSFAVLVDVTGVIKNINPVERDALKVVSYIGCTISVLCLFVTVVFFLAQGKKLFRALHYFVHLNLSISLLLAYLVFSVGIETAVGNMIGCAFVAALLHYLFLSTFCWMLCEGVMLYLLLVRVFSGTSKRWWFFLLLGYVTPLPFVVVTLGARWQYYGVKDTDENLKFCWLSTDKGTIFGFVAPMLIIILINIVFLGFALRALWKSQRSQLKRIMQEEDERKQVLSVARSVLLASVVLLPLLGLTWVFGILTVNSNTTFFAWIFTILNSLQGLGIFFFHVIRSDQVWTKIRPKLSTLMRSLACCNSKAKSGQTSTLSGIRSKSTKPAGSTELGTSHQKRSTSSSSTSDNNLRTSEDSESKFKLRDLSTFKKVPENAKVYDGFSDPVASGYPISDSTYLENLNWIINPAASKSTTSKFGNRKINSVASPGYHRSTECHARPNNSIVENRTPFRGATQAGMKRGFVYRKMSDTLNSFPVKK